MNITEEMIAPDLRRAGRFYKKLMGETACAKPPKLRHTDPGGRLFETLLRRDDGSFLRMLITKPKKRDRVPGVLWLHGGGFLTGMPEMVHFSPAHIIKNDCVIVSPDYTLSSKKPYPAALLDCYAALLWMVKNADSLGIDSERIYVGGESAGGGLCVSVCMLAKRLGCVNIACQMPLYPMLDDRMESASMKDNDAPVWNENRNSQAWALYLRGL